MVATLRVMLDLAPTELREPTVELARALAATAPRGCDVRGIVPAGEADAATDAVAGLAAVHVSRLPRRELVTALQLGAPTGIGGGMIHSASLVAPLVRHDRAHEGDQTVVSLWDLRAWEAGDELARGAVAWQRGMLKRAVRHADAVVVPTHGFAGRLLGIAPKLADRVRVIAGAAPIGFAVPRDEVGRRRSLDLPDGYVVVSGSAAASDGLAEAFAAIAASGVDVPVVVIDAREGEEPAIVESASAAGVSASRLHVRGLLDAADRGAVFGGAVALIAPSRRTAFPWRLLEALAVGVPVVAASSAVHTDVVLDGGILYESVDAAAAGITAALGSAASAERLGVLAADRGRAFSWRDAAMRVWELHAEL